MAACWFVTSSGVPGMWRVVTVENQLVYISRLFVDVALLVLLPLPYDPQRCVLQILKNTLTETLVKCFSICGEAFSSIFRQHRTVDSCHILHYPCFKKKQRS